MVRMAPFKRKIDTPINETTTGCEDLLSGSGGVIRIVRTEPKLVPTHNVGVNTVGSIYAYIKRKQTNKRN